MPTQKLTVNQFTDPAECLQEIVTAFTDYLKVAEEEKTKRRDIEAWEKTTIAQIDAQREFVMSYLDRTFDERANNFRALFAVVDNAILSENNQQLGMALNSITELAKSSPFRALADINQVRAALDDPNHEWVF